MIYQHLAHLGEFQIGFASDDVVGELDDGLPLGLIADLRSAKNDFDVRLDALDGGNDLGGGLDVPDINAEADNFGILREEDFRDVERALVDVKFYEAGARLERAEVGQQVAQAERGVDVLRVERG